MTKEEWYADRIMWRAGQHGLFEKRCCRFENLNEKQIEALVLARYTGKPLLVFFSSMDRWTLLTTNEIISFFDGELRTALLDGIFKDIKLVRPPEANSTAELKETAHRLHLTRTNQEIWAPEGEEIFALMNILQMFPLKVP
jgi:hypothetical protein